MMHHGFYPGSITPPTRREETDEERERREDRARMAAEFQSVAGRRAEAPLPHQVVKPDQGCCCLCWPKRVEGKRKSTTSDRLLCDDCADTYLAVINQPEEEEEE